MYGPAGYARRRRSSASSGAIRCSPYFPLSTTSYLLLPTTSYFPLPTSHFLLHASYYYSYDCLPLTTDHKVLFLDVLFPLKVKRVIYIDSDQLVRAVRASSTRPPHGPAGPTPTNRPVHSPTTHLTYPPAAGCGRVGRPRHAGRARGDDTLLHSRPQRGDARLPLLGVGLLEGKLGSQHACE